MKESEAILKKSGLKVTKERVSLLELLFCSGPVSIDHIHTKLSGVMSITTVYRILEKFVEKGIVYQTDFRDGKAYFEFQDTHHHHIVCTKCGVREDVSLCIEKEMKEVEKGSKKFSSIDSHALEFFGLCKECA